MDLSSNTIIDDDQYLVLNVFLDRFTGKYTKALKLLSNQEFMPYIVFIKCPSTVDDLYSMKLKSLNPSKFKNVTF